MSNQPDDPSAAGTSSTSSRWTRRSFLKGVGAAAVSTEAVLARAAHGADDAPPASDAVNTVLEGPQKLALSINDQQRQMTVEPRTTLLSALRDHLVLDSIPSDASDLLDPSGHCWCHHTQQPIGPDGLHVLPDQCVPGRGCYRSALSPLTPLTEVLS